MLEVNGNSVFKLKPSASVRSITGDAFFILDSDYGKQYNLTEMEYEILNLISGGRTFSEIVRHISLNYNADAVQIESDLREYYVSLFEAGLICQ